MVLDRALADAQLVGDDLVLTPLNDKVQDPAFAPAQGGDTLSRRIAPRAELREILTALQRALDARQKLIGANRLLQEIRGTVSSPGLPSRRRHGR